jgi:hypothetical protein
MDFFGRFDRPARTNAFSFWFKILQFLCGNPAKRRAPSSAAAAFYGANKFSALKNWQRPTLDRIFFSAGKTMEESGRRKKSVEERLPAYLR